MQAEQRIQGHNDTTVGGMRKRPNYDRHRQPGDVGKGRKVIRDVLTKQPGKSILIRLVLGSGCYTITKEKCERTLKLLEEREDFACSTD